MSLQLVPADALDAPLIGELMTQCSTSPRIVLEFQDCKREDFLRWNIDGARAELQAVTRWSSSEAEAFKVVEAGREDMVAGYAVWCYSERACHATFISRNDLPLPEGANVALRKAFIDELMEMENAHRPGSRHLELLQLATSPNYQRRGIGSMLVNYGLEKADREGKEVFLSGSPMGVLLYRKLGFEEVGRLEIPLGPYGGNEGENHIHVAMVRKPRKLEQAAKG